MTYEEMLIHAGNEGLVVLEKPLSGSNGRLYKNRVAIRSDLKTSIEKNCTLAEEIGHHKTTYGDITRLDSISSKKQEYRARIYGYNLTIGLDGIIKCFEYGCRNKYEMAEYLDVTESFLEEAIEKYHSIYGSFAVYEKYIIYFEPNLTVLKMK